MTEPIPGAVQIANERARQINCESWTPEHDDEHNKGELAFAGACYAFHAGDQARGFRHPTHATAPLTYWPWGAEWWKPKDPIRDLVRAGALIAAEIDRLQRAAALESGERKP